MIEYCLCNASSTIKKTKQQSKDRSSNSGRSKYIIYHTFPPTLLFSYRILVSVHWIYAYALALLIVTLLMIHALVVYFVVVKLFRIDHFVNIQQNLCFFRIIKKLRLINICI